MIITRSGRGIVRPDWVPADHDFVSWSNDWADNSNNGALPIAGTVYLVKLHVVQPAVVGSIWVHVASAGGTLTAGQCFAGLYQGGSLRGSTADQAAAWGTTGAKQMAINGGPVEVAEGDVYAALLFNGTTGPSITRSNTNTGMINVNLAASASRFASANGGQTSLPATIGALSAQNTHAWIVALSAT